MKEKLPKDVQRGIGLRKCSNENGVLVLFDTEDKRFHAWKSGLCVKYDPVTSTASIGREYRRQLEPRSVISWLLDAVQKMGN